MDALQDFENYLTFERRSSTTTVQSHRWHITKFLKFASKPPNEIQVKDIQDFLQTLNIKQQSNGTISNYIATLRVFYGWYGYHHKSAEMMDVYYYLKNILRLRTDKSIPNVPKHEEMRRLSVCLKVFKRGFAFNKKNKEYRELLRDATLIELVRITAARSKEVRSIAVRDLDLEDGTVLITKGKGGKQRVSLFNDWTKQLLKEWIEYEKLGAYDRLFNLNGSQNIITIIRKWAKRAGINEAIHCHSIRHYHITKAREDGVPDNFIKDQVGNYTCLDKYTHLSLNSRRKKYGVCEIK